MRTPYPARIGQTTLPACGAVVVDTHQLAPPVYQQTRTAELGRQLEGRSPG